MLLHRTMSYSTCKTAQTGGVLCGVCRAALGGEGLISMPSGDQRASPWQQAGQQRGCWLVRGPPGWGINTSRSSQQTGFSFHSFIYLYVESYRLLLNWGHYKCKSLYPFIFFMCVCCCETPVLVWLLFVFFIRALGEGPLWKTSKSGVKRWVLFYPDCPLHCP